MENYSHKFGGNAQTQIKFRLSKSTRIRSSTIKKRKQCRFQKERKSQKDWLEYIWGLLEIFRNFRMLKEFQILQRKKWLRNSSLSSCGEEKFQRKQLIFVYAC